MARDRSNNEIVQGETVLVRAVVQAMTPGDDSMVTLALQKPDGLSKMHFDLPSRSLEKVTPPPAAPASPAAPPPPAEAAPAATPPQ